MSNSLYWLIRKFEDVPDNDDWLSDAEGNILAGFRFPKRRNDWRLGRWTAKKAICAYQSRKDPVLGVCPSNISGPFHYSDRLLASLEIRAAEDGAPEAFWDGAPGKVSISISHSHSRGFCVVGPAEFSVGCDTERVEPREVQFFQDYFTPEEIALLQNGHAERSLVAYLIWCAKESALKALRQGLRLDTRSIIVRPDFGAPEGSWNTWTGRCMDSPRSFCGWWRFQDGFIYAMTADQITSPPKPLSV